jgi:transcriptional regulator with XRE-family HTH domain
MASTTNGDRVRELRKQKAWNAETLARKAGVSTSTIWNAERGKGLHVLTLECIAGALGVKIEEIVAPISKRVNMQLILNIDFSKCDQDRCDAILDFLRKLVPDGGDMEIKGAEPSNSTKITIEMDLDDILRLYMELEKLIGSENFPLISYKSDAPNDEELKHIIRSMPKRRGIGPALLEELMKMKEEAERRRNGGDVIAETRTPFQSPRQIAKPKETSKDGGN